MTCLNCEHEHSANYCPNCGQKATTGRITFRKLLKDLFTGITELNKGFLFNIKALTLAPRRTILGYIQGRRKHMYNPLQYAIIGVTILTLVDINFKESISLPLSEGFSETESFDWGYQYGRFLRNNIKFLWLLNIFFFSILNTQFFPKFNLAEHLTINAFIIGHSALITTALFPVCRLALIVNPVLIGTILLLNSLVFWRQKPGWEVIVYSILNLLVGYLLFFLTPIPFHLLLFG